MVEASESRNVFEKIRSDITRAEQSQGWSHLSTLQKRLISAALYVNVRAQRGYTEIDKINNDDLIQSFGQLSMRSAVRDRVRDIHGHRRSLQHFEDYMCNASIAVLEDADSVFSKLEVIRGTAIDSSIFPPRTLPRDFARGTYDTFFKYDEAFPLLELETWKSELKAEQFPYVAHIQPRFPASERDAGSMHTFLILGEVDGELITFEKIARREPYRIGTVKTILKEYPFDRVDICLRPMKRSLE